MPIFRPQFINGEIYHIVTRGVEKRPIFNNKSDRYRAIFSLYEFNNNNPVLIRNRRRARALEKKTGREQFSAKRNLMVEILAFCLMPNHIHLLLRQIQESGISNFMRKFGAGYAAYFNKKYDRVGHLFQGRFRAVHIKNNSQLKNVFVYIHTNPTEIINPGWKERGLKNTRATIDFLENYKWSSYSDYIGGKNFPSVTQRNFIIKIMKNRENCRDFVNQWIKYKRKISELKSINLE